MRIHHIAIQVHNLSLARTFYGNILQLPEIQEQAHSIWFDVHGVILMIEFCSQEPRLSAWKSEQPGFHLLAFSIQREQREAYKKRFEQFNIPIETESNYTIYIRDPFGNRLGFSHYPERLVP